MGITRYLSDAVFRIADHVRADIWSGPRLCLVQALLKYATSVCRPSVGQVAKETFPN